MKKTGYVVPILISVVALVLGIGMTYFRMARTTQALRENNKDLRKTLEDYEARLEAQKSDEEGIPPRYWSEFLKNAYNLPGIRRNTVKGIAEETGFSKKISAWLLRTIVTRFEGIARCYEDRVGRRVTFQEYIEMCELLGKDLEKELEGSPTKDSMERALNEVLDEG